MTLVLLGLLVLQPACHDDSTVLWPDASYVDQATCTDEGPATKTGPCVHGSCGAGYVCVQDHGGAVNLDGGTDTSFCARVPCSCASAPTCACLAQNTSACNLTCAPAGDAADLGFDVFGDFLCLGQ